MRWPREDWLEALSLSQDERLRAPERAVALACWSLARDGIDHVQAPVKPSSRHPDRPALQPRTGLGRTAVEDALRHLVATGWLTPAEPPRRGATTRYVLTTPTRDARQPVISKAVDARNAGMLVTQDAREAVISPSGDDREATDVDRQTVISPIAPSSSTETPPPQAAHELWLVVLDRLPDPLALSLTQTRSVTDICRRLADDGWTPETLSNATAARSWNGCQAGGVVAWLRDLPPAGHTTSPALPAAPSKCRVRGHEYAAVTAAGCSACRFENLGASA